MRSDPTHVRRLLWLRLMEMADLLRELADEWIAYDRELADLERLVTGAPEQWELPFGDDRGAPF